MGFIEDPGSRPAAHVGVGGKNIVTENGDTNGDFLDYQGGWIPVTAIGYASGNAIALALDPGFLFL